MNTKALKLVLVIIASVLAIWGLLSLIYGNFELKMLYYKLILPTVKY